MTSHPDQRRGCSGGLVSVASAAVAGITGYPVHVEVHAAHGLPGFTIVGAPDAMCRETRDRVRAAVVNSGLQWPTTRITVNIAPPGTARPTSSLDLAIAVGVLAADGQVSRDSIENHSFISELGLDGTLRPVPAGICLVEAVTTRRVVVAPPMVTEARLASRPIVRAAADLRSVADALNRRCSWPDTPPTPGMAPSDTPSDDHRLSGPPGHRAALVIAAAGGHTLLLVGPHDIEPATTARQLAGLAPDLTDTEALDVSRVYSAAGHPLPVGGLIRRPPLRCPNPDTSAVALIGGATRQLSPGEASLAHNGTLFLDDLSAYPRAVLDTLVPPLDEGAIHIARANARVSLPARFQLIAAMRPCPCGDLPERCQCSATARARYARRISGPLLDRFDLRVTPDRLGYLTAVPLSDDIEGVVDRIEAVRSSAAARDVRTNTELRAALLDEIAPLDHDARGLIDRALWTARLTGHGVAAVRRVALTIADLRGDRPPLTHVHVGAALALRPAVPQHPTD